MWRIRKRDLENAVEQLNAVSKRKYGLYGAYGKWQLVRYCNDKDTRGGVTAISSLLSKRELHALIWTILSYVQGEERAKRS